MDAEGGAYFGRASVFHVAQDKRRAFRGRKALQRGRLHGSDFPAQ